MMSTLRGFLGDGADEKIKTAMSMLSQSGLLQPEEKQNVKPSQGLADAINDDIKIDAKTDNSSQLKPANNVSPMLTPEGLQFMSQMKDMVDRISNTNDSRSELLRSLRPFMRSERQRSIDKAIRIINIGRFSGLFGK